MSQGSFGLRDTSTGGGASTSEDDREQEDDSQFEVSARGTPKLLLPRYLYLLEPFSMLCLHAAEQRTVLRSHTISNFVHTRYAQRTLSDMYICGSNRRFLINVFAKYEHSEFEHLLEAGRVTVFPIY